jgi:hypothetical protein
MSRNAAARTPTAPHLVDTLLAALRAESDALVRGAPEALAEAALAKAESLQQIAAALRAAPGDEQRTLRTHLVRAREMNELNAALVSTRIAVTRGRLEALMGAAGIATAQTYGAQGLVSTGGAGRAVTQA